jgi:hypothetical protein
MVTVTGYAEDESEVVSLEVDDEAQAMSPGGRADFSLPRASRWGLNVVSVTVRDACGNVGYGALPFMRSGSYYAASTAASPPTPISNALTAQLSQTVVDDGNRNDLDDLASIGQAILDGVDVNGMVVLGEVLSQGAVRTDCTGFPGPTFESVGHAVQRHPNPAYHLTAEVLVDELRFYDGAVGFGVRVQNVNIPLRAAVGVVQCVTGVPSSEQITVDATVGLTSLSASGIIGANVANGSVQTGVQAIDFSVNGLFLDLACGDLGWACDEITGFITGALEGIVSDAVEGMVVDQLGTMSAISPRAMC